MKRLLLHCTILLSLAAASTAHGQAVLISRWNFVNAATADWGPSPKPADSVNSNVTVVGLTRGSGIAPGSGSTAANAWGAVGFNDGVASASQNADTAAARGNYVVFSLRAKPGYSLSLSEIAAYNIRRSGTGPAVTLWQYSLDSVNFINIDSSFTLPTTTASGNSRPAVSLTGIAALQNVPATTPVIFRVLAWGATLDAGTWYFNAGPLNQNLTINGTVNNTPLPLDLLSFNGKKEDKANYLEWVTAREKNVSRFELERGTDGRSFSRIASIKATGNGNAADNHYSYSDDANAPVAYYRLRMVDADGRANYSNVVVLRNVGLSATAKVYPNPVDHRLFLEGTDAGAVYYITDAAGKIVAASAVSGTVTAIDVAGLPQGIYFLSVHSGDRKETIRFVKK
jgi:hypothetical protein